MTREEVKTLKDEELEGAAGGIHFIRRDADLENETSRPKKPKDTAPTEKIWIEVI